MIKRIEYLTFADCFEISNGIARLVMPTAFGPRVLFYGLDGGENVFGWHPEAMVDTELGRWKPYGGHRLWAAPEHMPLSYAPDNAPVTCTEHGEYSITIVQDVDTSTGLQKQLTIRLDPDGTGVSVDHRIKNCGAAATQISAWALTIMRPGGTAVVPNEPLKPYGGDTLLPARTMALWPYTDLTDRRWKFEQDHVRLCCDENLGTPQKFGVLNKQGWAVYEMEGIVFIKRFDFNEAAVYPDMNSNTEIYTAGGFIEVESLSPLCTIDAGKTIEHRETWGLAGHLADLTE